MKVNRSIIGIAALAVACSSAAACSAPGSSSKTSSNNSDYVVGISASMTGPASAFGKQEGTAAQIMFDQINAKGGIDGHKVKVILRDNASNPEQASLDAKAFIAAKADVIMVGATQTTMHAVEPFAKNTLVVDFGSGYVPPANSNVFSVSPYDAAPAAATMDWFKSKGITNIGVIASTDITGETAVASVKNALSSSGGDDISLADTQRFDPTSPDVTPQLTQLRAHGAGGVVAWVSGSAAGVVAKSYTQLGGTAPLVVSWANGSYSFAAATASFQPSELFVPVPRALLPDDPANATYAKRIEPLAAALKDKGEKLDLGGTLVWDPIQIAVRALQGGKTVSERVKAIENAQGFEGIWGTYHFSSSDHKGGGHAGNPAMTMAQMKNGTLVPAS